MDPEDSPVKGAVVVIHKVHEGKHQYGVEKVVKFKKASGAKSFARVGDLLMEINDIDLQNVTPEELAQMLAEGNSKLTLHKSKKMKGNIEIPLLAEDTLFPVSKETMFLSFSMELRREDNSEENEVEKEGGGKEDTVKEEDVCKEQNEETGDMIIVSMTKTSITLVSGRGCDHEGTCPECRGAVCSLNDVIMMAESSTVVLVPRGGSSLIKMKTANVKLEHMASELYLRGICSQRQIYASPNPEPITIYYYKSNVDSGRGIAVVLNVTGSNCYFRCCKQGQAVLLQLETCEEQKLKRISTSDESTFAFVFYMKGLRTRERKFESALHLGWFIQITDTGQVKLETQDIGTEEQSFFFIIQK